MKKEIPELHDIPLPFGNPVLKLEPAYGELNRRILELSAIKGLTDIARKILNIDDLMDALLEKSMQATGAKIGSVFVVDPATERLRIVAARGHKETLKKDSYINVSDSLVKSVLLMETPLLVLDIENDPRTCKSNNPVYGPPSFLSMPIYTGNTLAAVVNLAHKESGQPFDADDQQVLAIMLGEIGFALENAILHLKVAEQLEEIKGHNVRLEREIAERMQAEKALRQSDEMYRAVFENTGTAIAIVDENTTILLGNTGIVKLTGYSKEEVEGKKSWTEFVAKDYLEKLLENQSLRHNNPDFLPKEYECQLINKQGDVNDVLMTAATIPGIRHTVVSFLDITDRKRNEKKLAILNEELEESNRQLGMAYAKMKDDRDQLREDLYKEDIGFLIDREGLIEGVTERAIDYTGVKRNALIGSNIVDLFQANCRNTFKDELRRAWIGVARETTVEMLPAGESNNVMVLKLIRISLDGKRLLLAILR